MRGEAGVWAVLRGRAPLLALGGGFLVSAILLGVLEIQRGTPVTNAFFLSLFAFVPGLILVYGCHRLPHANIDPRSYLTISKWSYGAVGFMLFLLSAYHILPPVRLENFFRASLVISGFVLVPAFAGGVNAARLQTRTFELERTLDLLEKTEQTANVGGWEIDIETQDVFWSKQLFDILDWPDDEAPQLDAALQVYHEEDRPLIANAIDTAVERGEGFDIEARIFTESGELRWLRVQGIPDMQDGQLVSLRGAAQDITERKQRERALEASNERLEQFAHAASHDLQEPLRMVSRYVHLIDKRYGDDLPPDADEFLEYAVDGADHMRAMVEGLLAYSRIDPADTQLVSVELNGVVGKATDDLAHLVAKSGAEIEVGDLPRVRGDPDQLRQVFQNLLRNAIQYSGDDEPRVTISAARQNGRWVISVSDEGIGIHPDEQDRIFEVFERLHSRHRGSGSGIGLALCERIIERHEGNIWVESAPGEGSTFSFDLPADTGT